MPDGPASRRSVAGGERQGAQAGPAKDELEGLGVQDVEVKARARVEHEHAFRPLTRRREPLQRGQPAGRVAPGEVELGSAGRLMNEMIAARSTSSIVRSIERRARLSSSRRLAISSSKARRAAARRPLLDGPAPRCWERATAEETFRVFSQRGLEGLDLGQSVLRWPPGSGAGGGIRSVAPNCAACSGSPRACGSRIGADSAHSHCELSTLGRRGASGAHDRAPMAMSGHPWWRAPDRRARDDPEPHHPSGRVWAFYRPAASSAVEGSAPSSATSSR